MIPLAKLLVTTGIVLVLAGGLLWGLARTGFRGLPGDIHYHGDNTRISLPIVTCLVASILLSAILWAWRWWRGS